MVSEGSSKCDLNVAKESMITISGEKNEKWKKKKPYKKNFFLLFPLGVKVVKTKALSHFPSGSVHL